MLKNTFAALAIAALTVAASAPSHADEALDSVIKRGTVRIVTLGSLPPFTQLTPTGEMEGYEIDIGNRLAKELGVKAEFAVTDSAGRVASLQTKKADLTIADFTRTVQRSTVIAFSDPYLITYQQAMLMTDSPVKTSADLNDAKYRVGFNRGGVGEKTVEKWFPNAQKSRYAGNADALSALLAGQVDAIVEDAYYNAEIIQKYDGKVRQLPEKLTRLEIAIAMPAGNPDWLRVVNLWIEQFNASGENAELFKKWFGVEMLK